LKTRNGNPALVALIRTEIEKHGPVSFDWFMQQALYHSEHGYYSSGRCAIGREGDYFTNISVGPLFGRLMAAQFAQIWEGLGKINNFVIVEQGAHDGQFALDVLQSARERTREFFEAIRYRVIEPFPILRERQSQMLKTFADKVEWRDSLEPFIGVHFSNELLDAMAVRLISGAREKLVDFQDGRFVFVERPSSNVVFNKPALDWLHSVTANLQQGYVIIVDYGHSGDESQRNIQVRARHRHLDSPFEQIGQADITMHVDWPSIARCAEANGLRIAGFADQHHFLTGIISSWPDLLEARSSNRTRESFGSEPPVIDLDDKTRRALQTLLHPEMLGRSFEVLGLEKSINAVAPLAGFQFARARRFSDEY
jgi:SAM-dependent MidA family methyltransferase